MEIKFFSFLMVFSLTFSVFCKEKQLCKPITKGYLKVNFGVSTLPFDKYLKLSESRRLYVKKGKSVESYVKKDKYSYGSISEGVRKYKNLNRISSDRIEESREIILPFCANHKNLKRKIGKKVRKNVKRRLASLRKSQMKTKSKRIEKTSNWNFGLSSQFGSLDVENSEENFNMTFIKLGGVSSYKLGTSLNLSSRISVVQFFNIKHSDTDTVVGSSNPYLEFGFGLSKKIGRLGFGIGYDYMQYFMRDVSAQGISLLPSVVNRAEGRVSYDVTEGLSVLGTIGVLDNFENNNISGFDTSLGMRYSFGKRNQFSIVPLLYKANIERDTADSTDDSTVFAVSFSYDF